MMSIPAMSQTLITSSGDWIEVPPGKRAVFIKETMPVEHCVVVCTAPVIEPVVPTSVNIDGFCDGEPHPNSDDPDCVCQFDGLVVSPSVVPEYCNDYPY